MKTFKVLDRYDIPEEFDTSKMELEEQQNLSRRFIELETVLNIYGKRVYDIVDKDGKVVGVQSPPKGFDFNTFSEEKKKAVRKIVGFEVLEQGCQVFYGGEKYPIKHHAIYERVNKVGMAKHIVFFLTVPIRQKGIFKKIIGGLFLFQNVSRLIDWMYGSLSDEIYPDSRFYCQSVAELYRVVKYEKLRDVVCTIIDSDSAYRFRLQDIFSNLDKELLKRDPIKELDRLAQIGFVREHTDDGLYNFKKVWKFLKIYLWFNRKLLNQIKEVLLEMDIEEVRPHLYDTYYTYKFYPEYDFDGKNFEERLKIAETL